MHCNADILYGKLKKYKISVETSNNIERQILSAGISELQLNRVERWIIKYCCWFSKKGISSLRIVSEKIENTNTVKWIFTNTRNDICIHRCITRYLNFILKNSNAYIYSMQRNNRGHFILMLS